MDSINNREDELAIGNIFRCFCGDRSVITPGQILTSQQSTGGNPLSVFLKLGTAMTVSISAIANATGSDEKGRLRAWLELTDEHSSNAKSLGDGEHKGRGLLSVSLAAVFRLKADTEYVVKFDDEGEHNASGINYLKVALISVP